MGRRGWRMGVEEASFCVRGGVCVRECCALLRDIVLQDHTTDMWKWLRDPVHGYTVKGAYHFLTSVDEPPAMGFFFFIMFGINMSRLKFLYFLGDFFATVYR